LLKEAEKLEQFLSEPSTRPGRSVTTVLGDLRNLRSGAAVLRDQANQLVEGEAQLVS